MLEVYLEHPTVSSEFIGTELPLTCGLSGGRCTGLSVVRGLFGSGSSWLVDAFVCAMVYVVRGDARPLLLLRLTRTQRRRPGFAKEGKSTIMSRIITKANPNRRQLTPQRNRAQPRNFRHPLKNPTRR